MINPVVKGRSSARSAAVVSLIFLAMSACVTGGNRAGEANPAVPVRVTLDYPAGCEPTEGFPHRFLVAGVAREATAVEDPTESIIAAVAPGATLTIITAVCHGDAGTCCTVTVERVFETDRTPPPAIVVVIPDPRESR